MNFKAVLALPKTTRSAQTHRSISFIWIVWSTLYAYLWVPYQFQGNFGVGTDVAICIFPANSINKCMCTFVNTFILDKIRCWVLFFRTFQECNVIKKAISKNHMYILHDRQFFYRTFHSAPTRPYIKKYVFFCIITYLFTYIDVNHRIFDFYWGFLQSIPYYCKESKS